MAPTEKNPFHDVFVTDSAPAADFVRYFSPFLVPHLPELFQQGNVILKGTQGSGKSMLLKLFQPEIRTAYCDRDILLRKAKFNGLEFPVPQGARNFVGAGVNLSKSGILDIAQLLTSRPQESDYHEMTALFSDFLNYWLLRDLLQSLSDMARNEHVFGDLVQHVHFDSFVKLISSQDCWFGYLDGCRTFNELDNRVSQRILYYRSWTARNLSSLPTEVIRSKTAIAEPLYRTADCLKDSGVISHDTLVFMRIDQMEELWHREGSQETITRHFRQAINRAIGNRDLRVSFRIGTRRYAWSDELAMPGGRELEQDRDYLVIELDHRLRRAEDSGGWLFKGFAADVFKHRILANLEKSDVDLESIQPQMSTFFGSSSSAYEIIEKLIVSPPEDPKKLLKLDDEWSDEWVQYIKKIYNKQLTRPKLNVSPNYAKNPIDALLIVAWGLQTGGGSQKQQRRSKKPPEHFPPWTVWWEKERLRLAVMQLVVRHQQTMFWWGTEKVLALSASNVTVFLSVCREVWDQWRRRSADPIENVKHKARISREAIVTWKMQAVAIDNVSKNWHRNFARQPGRPSGDIRMRFVDELGSWLRRKLLADSAMSYPGGNGISLRASELKSHPSLSALLQEAVGWGDIYEVDHTTKVSKEKHRDPRKKYYLNPILSPHFQLPEAHTKEPLYEPIGTIVKLAMQAGAVLDKQEHLDFNKS